MTERRGSHIVEAPKDSNVLTLTDTTVRRASVANPGFAALNNDARVGADSEKDMSIMQAFRLYPKAAAWSVLLSTSIVMEGYDTLLLANFFGLPQFNHKYGTFGPRLAATRSPPLGDLA